MYKIAILGCENSHANRFLTLISEGMYPDIEVVGIYSNEPEAVDKLNKQYGIYVMKDYAELVGKVDGIMITARHGDNHYKYAKPYLDSGIPMFIDKPITCNSEEAVEFMRECKEKGVRLCGGSTCAFLSETLALAKAVEEKEQGDTMGGNLVCPIHLDSPYGGFFFYAQHLVEVMTKIFGQDVQEIIANKREATLSFIAKYEDFDVTATYSSSNYYDISVFGKKSSRHEKLTFGENCFSHEMDDMHDLLVGKEMKKDYDTFIKPVFIMETIMRSAESGKWEKVKIKSV